MEGLATHLCVSFHMQQQLSVMQNTNRRIQWHEMECVYFLFDSSTLIKLLEENKLSHAHLFFTLALTLTLVLIFVYYYI